VQAEHDHGAHPPANDSAGAPCKHGAFVPRRRPSEAELDRLREAVASDPSAAQTRLRLGTGLLHAGQVQEAEAELRRAIELDPECAGAWVNLGGILLGRWDFAGTVEANRRAAACNPTLLGAHYNEGLAHMYLGQGEDMLRCFERVVELDPSSAGGVYHLAVAQFELGRVPQARESLARAMHLGFSPQPELLRALERAERPAPMISDAQSEQDGETLKP
jgi:tetratricopeptide (TPR) repeat protein